MEYQELKNYLDRNFSLREIAKESKKCLGSIRYWLKKHDLKPNFKNFKSGYEYESSIIDDHRVCPSCKNNKHVNEYYSRRKNNCSGYCRDCVARDTIQRGRKLKLECIKYKGGKCIKCGYKKCPAALDFHHRNPKEKDFSLCKKYGCRKINERIKKELDKCDLVCANCHREIHFKQSTKKWKAKKQIVRLGIEPRTSAL